jgi:hypothetical protein
VKRPLEQAEFALPAPKGVKNVKMPSPTPR